MRKKTALITGVTGQDGILLSKYLLEKKITVYGNGNQIREWLYVDDHSDALLTIIDNGNLGENYNVSDKNSITNLNLVKEKEKAPVKNKNMGSKILILPV